MGIRRFLAQRFERTKGKGEQVPLVKHRGTAPRNGAAERRIPRIVEPGKQEAILGPPDGLIRSCATPCVACGELVILGMPAQAIRGKRAQTILKHNCMHCESDLFSMTSIFGEMLVGVDCRVSESRVEMNHCAKLEVVDEVSESELTTLTHARLLITAPLVVGRGPGGKQALLSPSDTVPSTAPPNAAGGR